MGTCSACRSCGNRLLFSSRRAGRDLCGPCYRWRSGRETWADVVHAIFWKQFGPREPH